MTTVEVCTICDIAGCHHIRDRKADEELSISDATLDALVRDAALAADCMQETGTFETGQGILHDCARAITTLRAQLAEAQRLMRLERTIADKNADRADRAEAALAAQIEADAGIACRKCGASRAAWLKCSHIICLGGDAFGNQPHDRTALDRMLAETREKALREAAEILDEEGWLGMSMHRIRDLIEKPHLYGEAE